MEKHGNNYKTKMEQNMEKKQWKKMVITMDHKWRNYGKDCNNYGENMDGNNYGQKKENTKKIEISMEHK